MKLFGKPLLYAIIILVGANYVLGYFGLVEFHFDQLKHMFDIVEIPTIDVAFSSLVRWMSEHVILCISGLIGFAFGWRVG